MERKETHCDVIVCMETICIIVVMGGCHIDNRYKQLQRSYVGNGVNCTLIIVYVCLKLVSQTMNLLILMWSWWENRFADVTRIKQAPLCMNKIYQPIFQIKFKREKEVHIREVQGCCQ